MKKSISIFLVAAMLISLASCSKSTEATTTLETTPAPTTTTIEATTNYYEYIGEMLDINNIETMEYEPPFPITQNIVWDITSDIDTTEGNFYLSCFGFDNLKLRQNLIELTEEMTGQQNSQITINNFDYFNYYSLEEYSNGFVENRLYEELSEDSLQVNIARAVCVENNLRFLIDEIPACYFYERFPEFMRIIESGDCEDFLSAIYNYRICNESTSDTHVNYLDCYVNINNIDYVDFQNLEDDFLIDAIEFLACYRYNFMRVFYLMHGYGNDTNHSNDIRQVRDLRNNRNVLIPNEEQYENIMRELHELSGYENIDIYTVETPEEYYLSCGCYPSDLLSGERYELNYEPYVSPYEFDVVYIDQ